MEHAGSIRMRIIAIGIGVVMVLGAIGYRVFVHAPAPTPAATTSATSTELATLDTDGDGFPDWQEVLYGSDPKSATSTPENTARATSTSIPATSTPDIFAQSFLSQYLSASQNGTADISNPDQVGTSIANSVPTPTVDYTVVLAADITTVPAGSAAYATYQSALKKAVAPISSGVTEPEIATYGRLVAGDTTANAQLAHTVSIYQGVAATLKAMPVPKDALPVHLAAINALGYYAAVLETMRTDVSDAVTSLFLLRAYNDAERNMFTSFNELSGYLATHK